MPLRLVHHYDSNARIYIWDIQEDERELLSLFADEQQETERIKHISNPGRRLEKLAIRALLLKVLNAKAVDLNYDEYGRPELKSGEYEIAISHSNGLAALFLHKKLRLGLDIEHLDGRAFRLRAKFASLEEQSDILSWKDSQRAACLMWSAKESLYKWYGRKRVNFKEQLLLKLGGEVDNSGVFDARVEKEDCAKQLLVHHFRYKKWMVTYCAAPIEYKR